MTSSALQTFNAPLQLGDKEIVSETADGRFTVYKAGQRDQSARGAAPATTYSVHDSSTGKISALKTLAEIDSLIHFRRTGQQLGGWFNIAERAPKADLKPTDSTKRVSR
jgi:hypothetical protein